MDLLGRVVVKEFTEGHYAGVIDDIVGMRATSVTMRCAHNNRCITRDTARVCAGGRACVCGGRACLCGSACVC